MKDRFPELPPIDWRAVPFIDVKRALTALVEGCPSYDEVRTVWEDLQTNAAAIGGVRSPDLSGPPELPIAKTKPDASMTSDSLPAAIVAPTRPRRTVAFKDNDVSAAAAAKRGRTTDKRRETHGPSIQRPKRKLADDGLSDYTDPGTGSETEGDFCTEVSGLCEKTQEPLRPFRRTRSRVPKYEFAKTGRGTWDGMRRVGNNDRGALNNRLERLAPGEQAAHVYRSVANMVRTRSS